MSSETPALPPPPSTWLDANEESKKDRKRRKKEEKKRRQLLERFSEPTMPVTPPQPPGPAAAPSPRPSSRVFHAELRLATQRAGTLIAANAFLVAVSTFTMYRAVGAGHPWWALAPLLVTATLSCVLALWSAREEGAAQAPVELADLAPAEVKKVLDDLERRKALLRSAFNVLLGGLPLSVAALAVSFALATR